MSGEVGKTAIVFGASGGIGQALISALVAREDMGCVHAVARRAVASSAKVQPHICNILDEDALVNLARQIDTPDIVIVATGILSDGAELQPEKSYRHQNIDAFEQVFRVNTFGPALIAKHILPLMPRNGRSLFAVLSARVGSISDNRIGGWHAYRASKAALNMLVRNYAIEQARKNADAIIISLHPGTVDTPLSQPFQRGLPVGQVITPEQSANALLGVMDSLTPDDTGKAFDWKGAEIPA